MIAADIEALAGRPREATAILRWALDELHDMGITSVTSTMTAFLADALAAEGSIDDAVRYSRVSEKHATEVDVATQVMWRVARARATGDPNLADEAVRLAAPTDYLDVKARALAAAGDLDGARSAYEAKGNLAALKRLLAHPAASS